MRQRSWCLVPEQHVHVLKGDVTNKASLVAALQGADITYFMTGNKGPQGAAGEVIQGKQSPRPSMKYVGVKRVVLSSVQSADRTASIGGVPHFESKAEIEKLIKESELQWTILRPAAFMHFIPLSGLGRYMTLGLIGAILGQKKLQFIDGGYWYRRGEGDCRAGAIQRKHDRLGRGRALS